LLLLAIFFIAGCGSSDSSTTREEPVVKGDEPPARLDLRLAAQVEGVCRNTRVEIDGVSRRLAREIGNSSGPDAIGEALVAPGIRILRKEASQLEELPGVSGSPQLETYVGLFEPIIELAELRLEAGRAQEPERNRSLELLIAGLTEEQVTIARELGLDACSVGFTEALGGQQ
jgi:hypothetical protein